MAGSEKKWVLGILIGLFFLNVLAWLGAYGFSQSRLLEINFFDVGQGDATFIESPWRHQILIDGGPSSNISEKLAREMPFWDRNIDLIVLTHPEKDHMAGLIEVLKRYKVKNILWTGVLRDTAEFKEWQNLIEEEQEKDGARIKIAKAGAKIIFSGKEERTGQIEVLYPFEDLEGKIVKDSNDTSLVLKLSFEENSFLFTGDISKSVEKRLLAAGTDVSADVLKIAHHGSKTSSGQEFIERVSPGISIIPAGRNNSYGHPHQEVLEVLKKYATTIFRTDINGDIKIISDGKNYVSDF